MTDVADNPAANRFELERDGEVAHLDYVRDGDRLELTYTKVPEAFQGEGLGGLLVTGALDHARQHDLTVIPHCQYARGWMEKHPDALEGVRVDWDA